MTANKYNLHGGLKVDGSEKPRKIRGDFLFLLLQIVFIKTTAVSFAFILLPPIIWICG